jgi:hypothetical protein
MAICIKSRSKISRRKKDKKILMRKSGKELIAARKKAKEYRTQGKSHQWIAEKLGYKSKGGVQQLLGERKR